MTKSDLFSKTLKKLMKKYGWSQQELAAELGISQPSVSNYLGGRVPPADILYKMSKLFHLSMEELLTGGKGDTVYPAPEESFRVSEPTSGYGEKEMMLIEYFRTLDVETQKTLLHLLKKLSEKKNP